MFILKKPTFESGSYSNVLKEKKLFCREKLKFRLLALLHMIKIESYSNQTSRHFFVKNLWDSFVHHKYQTRSS